jgi:hypothetical protein
MRGATIFVMYADGAGNVTISARLGGGGHVEPVQNAALQAGVTLLEGSGIVDGNMIANVKCKPLSGNEEREREKIRLMTNRHNMQALLLFNLLRLSFHRSLVHWLCVQLRQRKHPYPTTRR